jgi:transposase
MIEGEPMFPIPSQLTSGVTDMSNPIDGISNIIAYELTQEFCTEQLFVFCGRHRKKIKTLQWTNNVLWLHYKCLEQGKFK